MVIHFSKSLVQAISEISHLEHHSFVISNTPRTLSNTDQILSLYGDAKWEIVQRLNETYSTNFDLHNWIAENQDDEVAYFLNEAGSNCLNYAEYKIPSKFHLWLGKNGFIIGIEQKDSFDVTKISQYSGGFGFFTKSKNTIFFDDPKNAKIIFMQQTLSNPAADRTSLP